MEKQVTERMQAKSGLHPRLMLDEERLSHLRELVAQDAKAKELLGCVRACADDLIANEPAPAYYDCGDDDEGWQRPVGKAMPTLALMWALTSEPKYLDAAKLWAERVCAYPTWGKNTRLNIDLVASHNLLGLSLLYDWCYDGLDEQMRSTIEETLYDRGGYIYRACQGETEIFWQPMWLQNHQYIAVASIGLAAAALYDKRPEVLAWLDTADAWLAKEMRLLADDGASMEGYMYWQYGIEYLLQWLAVDAELLGIDRQDHPWIRNASAYAIHMALPVANWSEEQNVVDIADCDRRSCRLYGSSGQAHILRRVASLFGDGRAQYLADRLDEKNLMAPKARWAELLWYDDKVAPQPLSDLPTLHHFENMGIVTKRSGWDGADETLLAMKCAPHLGHKAWKENVPAEDWGVGHAHPDVNHISLFGEGQWLLSDDGYATKLTSNHNTLLVDGKGQTGEGWVWLKWWELNVREDAPVMRTVEQTGDVVHIAGDGTAAYPPDCGLRKFVRHLFLVGKSKLFVVDEMETDRPCDLELRFFPEDQALSRDGEDYLVCGGASLRFVPHGTDGTAYSADLEKRYLTRKNVTSQKYDCFEEKRLLRATKRVDGSWVHACAFTWCKAGETPERVSDSEFEEILSRIDRE